MKEERIYYSCNFLRSLKCAYIVLIYDSNDNFHYLKRFILFERKDGFFDYKGEQFSIPKDESFFTTKDEVLTEFGTNPAELIIWENEVSLLSDDERIFQPIKITLKEINENSFLFQLRDKTAQPLKWLMKHVDSNKLAVKIHLLDSFRIDKSKIE